MFDKISRAVAAATLAFVILHAGTAAGQQAENYRENINKGTVSIISGGISGTYVRIAADLANVLDDGDNLRVLAIMGKGSVQNIDDILYLRGIDIGIVQSDVFAFVKRQNKHPTIDERIRYITKLYNEEFHLLAGTGIAKVEDLAGKRVNFGRQGSGTAMTASVIFDTLGIAVVPVYDDQSLALKKVKAGDTAAMVYVAGKPAAIFESIRTNDEVHFLNMPLSPALLETYLPSRLASQDYPGLIPAGEEVRTLAVGAVMAVYNWPEDHPRRKKVTRFINAFFDNFAAFQEPPRHPKWREVSLSATVPGWTRYAPAAAWLQHNAANQ
jgi:uncharacterized protein